MSSSEFVSYIVEIYQCRSHVDPRDRRASAMMSKVCRAGSWAFRPTARHPPSSSRISHAPPSYSAHSDLTQSASGTCSRSPALPWLWSPGACTRARCRFGGLPHSAPLPHSPILVESCLKPQLTSTTSPSVPSPALEPSPSPTHA